MAWFKTLKEGGYFKYENNPEPDEVENGFIVPFWDVLEYLEKLSIELGKNPDKDLTNEVLEIIKDVSNHPKDNYRTWHQFIKMLSNLPNDSVPVDILEFIPVWLSSRFDTMLQSSALCEKLLPKFLNDASTNEDIKKAETILKHLLAVKKVDNTSNGSFWGEGERFKLPVYHHYLTKVFEDRSIPILIVKYCSDNIVKGLGITLKTMLMDYPNGIQATLDTNERKILLKAVIYGDDLSVEASEDETVLLSFIIADYPNFPDGFIRQRILNEFSAAKIYYTVAEGTVDPVSRILFALNNDIFSAMGFNSVSKLGDRYNDSSALQILGFIFRELLDAYAVYDKDRTQELLRMFCTNKKYKVSFFKRVTIFTIGNHWEKLKQVFWDLVGESDENRLLSNSSFRKEVYQLLDKNQQNFNVTEKQIIGGIIAKGQVQHDWKIKSEDQDYWRLQWYSALKHIEPFASEYAKLSSELNLTSQHFEDLGEIRFRKGSESPLTVDQIVQKSNEELGHYLNTFTTLDSWKGPSIGGLAETLTAAVEEKPEKFSQEMAHFKGIYYEYAYHIIWGFSNAWKKGKDFDWNNVLEYCLAYIKDERFISGNLMGPTERYAATGDLVLGIIGNLITDGTQKDERAFAPGCNPLAEQIISLAVKYVQPKDDFDASDMDYPMYSLNSNPGKILRALLDLSLREGRLKLESEDYKWNKSLKVLFETAIEKNVIDAHILLGMYFQHFCFLDYDWIIEQIEREFVLQDKYWLAFMGGFAFCNPPNTPELYNSFFKHYLRLLKSGSHIFDKYSDGFIRHFAAFYFWKFESLKHDGLVKTFIESDRVEEIIKLIDFIGRQGDYAKSLSLEKAAEFRASIITLWQFILKQFAERDEESRADVLSSLLSWIEYLTVLDANSYGLISKSLPYVDRNYTRYEFIGRLVEFLNDGNPNIVAEYLARVLKQVELGDYFMGEEKKDISALVEFLFKHGQSSVAIVICNSLAIKGHFFLNELYEKYITE